MNIWVGIYVYGCLPPVILEVDMTLQLLHLVTRCAKTGKHWKLHSLGDRGSGQPPSCCPVPLRSCFIEIKDNVPFIFCMLYWPEVSHKNRGNSGGNSYVCMLRNMELVVHMTNAKIFLKFCKQKMGLTVGILEVVIPDCNPTDSREARCRGLEVEVGMR